MNLNNILKVAADKINANAHFAKGACRRIYKAFQVGMLGQIQFQYTASFFGRHFDGSACCRYSRGLLEIGRVVGAVVNEHRYSGILHYVCKLARRASGGKIQPGQVVVGGEGHKAGIRLTLLLRGKNGQRLGSQQLYQIIFNFRQIFDHEVPYAALLCMQSYESIILMLCRFHK
ncbi:MAG: hypothetical protein H6Q04_1543 [Acidobacteria bacterium]|nr:hypothetical protein [Acidobacteriota bacterium]